MASEDRFIRSQASIQNIQRSSFKSLSHSVKSSLNVGELVPFLVQEVLPGDTFKIDLNLVGRLQTPLAPSMDNLFLDYFFFFVPKRLVWNNWKYFMGESKSAWVDETIYRIPSIKLSDLLVDKKSFLDYLGVPPGDYIGSGLDIPISVLPRRAYDLIWNEWFRDQNLQDPLLTYEALDNPGPAEYERLSTATELLRVNKKHDYFTSCLPAPQKGPSVYLPFGDIVLPVVTKDHLTSPADVRERPIPAVHAKPATGTNPNPVQGALGAGTIGKVGVGVLSGYSTSQEITFDNLWADSTVNDSVFGAPTINALRFAFQVQKIYEKDARSGSRYVEIIRSHFGVISPDSRQQRPEFLHGGSEIIGIQQTVATASGANSDTESNLGEVGAFSYTQYSKDGVARSFTEHGYIIGLITLRYKHTYTQGIPKYLTRQDRFDFYDPALAHLGEQPVMKHEIFVDPNYDSDIFGKVFGYNEAWADYRYNLSRATACMRPNTGELGGLWTYADLYSNVPSLSESWIQEDKKNVERTLILASSTGVDNFFFDMYLDIMAIRPMPLYSIPGMIDHF